MKDSNFNISPFMSLHRYFLWADRMRLHVDEILRKIDGEMVIGSAKYINYSLYTSFWYGELFVVIEGWEELNLHDPEIDKLLSRTDLVGYLKRYRNGAFHYKKTYFDNRFMDLVSHPDSAKWIRELMAQYSRYFLEHMKNE